MSQSLTDAIGAFSPTFPLVVAYSGGADSTALLLACCQKWPGQVGAIHVHHGLQAAADGFQQHCEAVCATLNVPLIVRRVDAKPGAGQSPEDAARIARYRAFSELALEKWPPDTTGIAQFNGLHVRSIALAQHADDQVETILLALGRGAGLSGLSGMPKHWQRDGASYHRPLLDVSAQEIRSWLAAREVGFIEDPSNTDLRFTRNRIRARLLPAMQEVFPAFRDTFARSAGHAAQAQEVLQEVALQDLARVLRLSDDRPMIAELHLLSRARQANALRCWFKTRCMTTPNSAQLEELLDQVAACTTRGHKIDIKVGRGFARREGDVLAWYNP